MSSQKKISAHEQVIIDKIYGISEDIVTNPNNVEAAIKTWGEALNGFANLNAWCALAVGGHNISDVAGYNIGNARKMFEIWMNIFNNKTANSPGIAEQWASTLHGDFVKIPGANELLNSRVKALQAELEMPEAPQASSAKPKAARVPALV